jgi:hypothetical protein
LILTHVLPQAGKKHGDEKSLEVLLLERMLHQSHSAPCDVSTSLGVTIITTSFQSYLLPIDYARGDEVMYDVRIIVEEETLTAEHPIVTVIG